MRAKQVQFGFDSNWIKFGVDPKFYEYPICTPTIAHSVFLEGVILTGTLSKRNVDVDGYGYNLTLIQTKDPSKTHCYSWCYFDWKEPSPGERWR